MEKKYKTKMKRILVSPDKEIDKANSPLAILWRKILCDLGIGIDQWNYLMTSYITNPNNAIGLAKEDGDNARGKLSKSLAYTNMSIKVFQSGLRLLQCEHVIFRTRLLDSLDKVSIHSVDVWYGDHGKQKQPINIETKSEDKKPVNRFRRIISANNHMPYVCEDGSVSKPVLNMLARPDKNIGAATDVLSKMWRQILIDKKIDDTVWSGMMTSYLNKYVPIDAKPKTRSNVGGNFDKNLVKNRMTMLIFLRALALLDIQSYKLELTIKRRNLSKVTVHGESFPVPAPAIRFRETKKTICETNDN